MMKGVASRLIRLSTRGVGVTAVKALTATRALSAPAKAVFNIKTDPSMLKTAFRERLADERAKALEGGGAARMDKIHARGSLTARERLELLFDPGTFTEMDQLKAHRCTQFGMDEVNYPGDGIVTGYGDIHGRTVYAFSQDFSVCKILVYTRENAKAKPFSQCFFLCYTFLL